MDITITDLVAAFPDVSLADLLDAFPEIAVSGDLFFAAIEAGIDPFTGAPAA